jgi:hypothetical protein
LNSYVSAPDIVPLFHGQNINEGSYHFQDELVFREYTPFYTEISAKRRRNDEIRFDTILSVNNLGFDLLNIVLFVRKLDYSTIKQGDLFRLSIFVGKKQTNIIIRYAGQSVVEKGPDIKYKTLKLNIDIADNVFNASKNSMEVWLSDDENKIPVRMKAKLKIGAAEANLSSYKNLKKPFEAKIKIPRRK